MYSMSTNNMEGVVYIEDFGIRSTVVFYHGDSRGKREDRLGGLSQRAQRCVVYYMLCELCALLCGLCGLCG